MEADIAAIKSVLEQYALSCKSGDFDTWLSLWSEGGTQMPPDAPARVGKEEIRDGMKPLFDDMNLDIVIHSVDEAETEGDWGLTRCTYSLTVTPKEGGDSIEAMPEGKALTLYSRQTDGTWRISYDCFNSNVAPPQ
ncbi:MAG: nuclear transport factor 2 family protein [Acidobacteriota bacterium]